jgi:hypothetical protein
VHSLDMALPHGDVLTPLCDQVQLCMCIILQSCGIFCSCRGAGGWWGSSSTAMVVDCAWVHALQQALPWWWWWWEHNIGEGKVSTRAQLGATQADSRCCCCVGMAIPRLDSSHLSPAP